MYDVVSGASGQSWSMTSYCPAKGVGPQTPADNDYKPGFSADLMLKDLRLAQIASDDAGMTTQWALLPLNYIVALSKIVMAVVRISLLCCLI